MLRLKMVLRGASRSLALLLQAAQTSFGAVLTFASFRIGSAPVPADSAGLCVVAFNGCLTSFGCYACSVEFADGTVDDWSVDDMAPAARSQKTKRAKGASRRQQKRRLASMSTSELFEAGVKAFHEQQYEDALGLFEHAQQIMNPESDPQTTLNVYNFHGVRLQTVSVTVSVSTAALFASLLVLSRIQTATCSWCSGV
eukprot:COSAG02_NODE_894_length_16133_cov_5.336036_13_plen_198_part_00